MRRHDSLRKRIEQHKPKNIKSTLFIIGVIRLCFRFFTTKVSL